MALCWDFPAQSCSEEYVRYMSVDHSRPAGCADLDEIDWAILVELQRDGRLPVAQLARITGRDDAEITERLRRLVSTGVICGYHAAPGLAKLGFTVLAIVQLHHDGPRPKQLDRLLASRREILECLWIGADNCHILRVAASSMHHLADVVAALARYGQPTASIVSSVPLPNRGIGPPKRASTGQPNRDSALWAVS